MIHYISFNDFHEFLKSLENDYAVFAPVKKGNQLFYKKYRDVSGDIVVGEVRTFEPLKSFFFRAREVIARDFSPAVPGPDKRPLCIVGVKACDLKGFKIQDEVFSPQKKENSPEEIILDPFYVKQRRQNLIISADCTYSLETCFCLSLGLKPYPQENFDLNISEVKDGFVVETGSEKGQNIINKYVSFFKNATEEKIAARDEKRKSVVNQVEKNIKQNNIPTHDSFYNVIKKNYDSRIWFDEAETCVECGACNTVCPTCHCFLLYDQKNEAAMARLRVWDSCMIKDYARVAGGANPRHRLWMRLRNRFEKKFDFFPKIADTYACTGCGRCILACPAKIDIRKVLGKLVNDARK
ncbi:MAG: 4Fe-4S dicluster domain-containing protein [Candidatus Omnitrophota bacterium]